MYRTTDVVDVGVPAIGLPELHCPEKSSADLLRSRGQDRIQLVQPALSVQVKISHHFTIIIKHHQYLKAKAQNLILSLISD